MTTKWAQKKTGTNGDCGHETHLSNTECKIKSQRVKRLQHDTFAFWIQEAAEKMSRTLLSNQHIQPKTRYYPLVQVNSTRLD